MRVLLVSTSFPASAQDWKGVFIKHMVEALALRDDVDLKAWHPPGSSEENASQVASDMEQRWLVRLMEDGGIAHRLRTRPVAGLLSAMRLLAMLWRLYRRERSIDLYHVNWLQNALPLPRDGRPLMVTVLGTDLQLLKVPGVVACLRRAFSGRRVAICPNAGWMVSGLEKRFGDLATIRCVPLGIEPRWFEVARQATAPARWLCVSRLTAGKIGDLFEWCEPWFRDGRRELHLIGPMQQPMPLPGWIHYHSATNANELCRDWFPSAAGLITLSRHAEGRPQVMLEAMAAGLPIIASSLPAHTDVLEHGATGWLCHDAADVGNALNALDDGATNRAMGQRARQWVQSEIGTWDDCAQRYANAYRDLLDK